MVKARLTGLGALLVVGAVSMAACSSSPAHRASTTATSIAAGDTGETTSTLSYDPAPPTGPATTASTTQPVVTTTTTAPGTVLTVTGASPATQVTINVGAQQTQHTGVPLPWSETLTADPGIVVLLAQTGSGDPSATVTCSIAPPAQRPVTNTSTGAYATVTCEDNTDIP